MRERERFDFLCERDGEAAALEFAQRVYRRYRAALRDKRSRYGQAFRRPLVRSCIELRAIIRSMK